MILGTDDSHGIQQRDITLIVIRCIGVKLQTIVLHRDLRESRRLRLTEHAGKEVEIVLHIMVFAVFQQVRIFGIICLHSFAAVRIIALMSTGGADEVERTFIRAIRTAFITRSVLVAIHRHLLAIRDST